MRLWRTTWGLRLANLNVRYGGNMSEEKKEVKPVIKPVKAVAKPAKAKAIFNIDPNFLKQNWLLSCRDLPVLNCLFCI